MVLLLLQSAARNNTISTVVRERGGIKNLKISDSQNTELSVISKILEVGLTILPPSIDLFFTMKHYRMIL